MDVYSHIANACVELTTALHCALGQSHHPVRSIWPGCMSLSQTQQEASQSHTTAQGTTE